MFNSNPWMLLLWIIALVMALIPLLIILWSGLCAGYFKAKENHTSKIIKAFSETFKQASDILAKKVANKTSGNSETDKKEE